MLAYIIRRVLFAFLIVWIAATLVFVVMHAVPGGPFDGARIMSDAARANLNQLYGLDLPVYKQYINYMKSLLRGDFGTSFKYKGLRVLEIIKRRFPITASIGASALVFTSIVGIPLGILASLKRNSWWDYSIMFFASLGYAIPNFVTGLFLLLLLAVKLRLFPVGGWGSPLSIVLPTIALSLPSVCLVARLMRASMLDTLGEEYIKTAKAKGLSLRFVIGKHAFRNAAIPVITVLGVIGCYMISGNIIIETIFAIPGLGAFFASSIKDMDYSVVMGITLLYAAIILCANLLIDLAYMVIDPRVVYD